jgi:hypothetical protein
MEIFLVRIQDKALPSQVLNVNPNAFFFNQLAAQAIINRSTANNGIGTSGASGTEPVASR